MVSIKFIMQLLLKRLLPIKEKKSKLEYLFKCYVWTNVTESHTNNLYNLLCRKWVKSIFRRTNCWWKLRSWKSDQLQNVSASTTELLVFYSLLLFRVCNVAVYIFYSISKFCTLTWIKYTHSGMGVDKDLLSFRFH